MRGYLRRFFTDPKGNVAILFAIAVVPVIGSMGAAVDYSMASAQRTMMQAAVDATALGLAKLMPLTQTELDARGMEWFKANMGSTTVTNIKLSVTATTGKLNIQAQGTYQPEIVSVLGTLAFPVTAKSEVKWGNKRLRVALVLDTTGSMSAFNKIGSLKTATTNLLDQLKKAAVNPADVYVSIIPFSKSINAGAAYYNATWIDWTEWEDEPPFIKSNKPSNWEQIGPGSACPFTSSNYGFSCNSGPADTAPTTSTIPSSGTYSGSICPSRDTGAKISTKLGVNYNGCYNSVQKTRTISTGWSASCGTTVNCTCTGSGSTKTCKQTYYTHAWLKNARSTWNGCVTDRGTTTAPGTTAGNDQKVTTPTTTNVTTLFPAEQYYYCSPTVMPLSNDWTSLKNLVNGLFPAGSTNQPIGLVWGWQSLVGGGPFPTPPAKDPNYQYEDAIILMSDGLNTQDRWYGNGSSANTSVDYRMYDTTGKGTCANVKAAGITLYTVHVNTDSDPLSTLLKNCASSAKKFWMITSGDQLTAVFGQIATELANLHLSK